MFSATMDFLASSPSVAAEIPALSIATAGKPAVAAPWLPALGGTVTFALMSA